MSDQGENLQPHQNPSGGVWFSAHESDRKATGPHNIRFLRGTSLPLRQHGTLDVGVASHGLSAPQPGEVPASSAPAPTPGTGDGE
jgi:hypothetical protein